MRIVPSPYLVLCDPGKGSKSPEGLLFGADRQRITHLHLFRRPQGTLER